MKTAAAYIRVSTEKQDEYSLDSQLKLIRQYASLHDMILPDEFVFVEDGVSGRTAAKRKSFQRMIAYAKDKSHPFDLILVWKFSRFARNQEESIFYKAALSRSGVDVISISETLEDSPFSSLIERIIEWMDEFYSIRLSGEVKRGMAEKLTRAEVLGPAPFGYDNAGKIFIPNKDAPIVERIFSDYLDGKGMRRIAEDLAAAGVRTKRGKLPENRWVKYILSNPVYIGKIRWSSGGKNNYTRSSPSGNELLIDGRFEPLVDKDMFAAVQEKLIRTSMSLPYTRTDAPAEFMLKGLLRCSACGSSLVYSPALKSVQCHKYAHGTCAASHSLSLKKANAAVVAELENCVQTGVFPLAPRTARASNISKDLARRIQAEEQKLRRVLEAYEAGVDTLEEYASKKKKLLDGIEELKALQFKEEAEQAKFRELSVDEMRTRVLSALKVIKDEQASEAAKNSALRTVLSHIVYEKSNSRLALYFLF